MKAMLKSELARMAGVSRNTLGRWFLVHEEELIARGYQRNMRLLPPSIVTFVMREYGIIDEVGSMGQRDRYTDPNES